MTDREMEERLRRAVTASVPDVFDGVLSGCEQKGRVSNMRVKRNHRRLSAIAAAILFVAAIGGFGWSQYSLYSTVDSIVGLDVNPGIEIRVNAKERVLEALAVNADGTAILDGMDLRGTQLDVAVNAVIGSMLKNGCIDALSNSILVTVESDDTVRARALQQRLVSDIGGILRGNAVQPAILSQTLEASEATSAMAEVYGISPGKASLIRNLTEGSTLHTAEELSSLSINELNLMASTQGVPLAGIDAVGEPSQDAYIGRDAAVAIALQHAGVGKEDAAYLRTEMDWDDGCAMYDVEFSAGGTEYSCDIDAVTGEVLEYDIDREDGPASQQQAEGGELSAADAQAAALSHAGLRAEDVRIIRCAPDYDDGALHYDVEFVCGSDVYEYEIHAGTGSVLDFDLDHDAYRQTDHPAADTDALPAEDIGGECARDIALQHAGISASEVRDWEAEKDKEAGRTVYEVEFAFGGYDYSYEIDASTGEILRSERERDD